ncbi:MAG: phosphoribosylformylglycinamidine synthase subunit PurQ, partial [Phaeodactylibacter sp.]|nr:phosphoribosylformylglycinamidine synthase subunit PurQ [Phaeodactylibacter sp.]
MRRLDLLDDRLILLLGGAAVSSADTGEFSTGIELNAVQRSNPEMQKRVANTIRNLVESARNPIVAIHDHGAGGHLNCFSELVEETGGRINMDQLPIGDPTLSAKEIIGNESQERMGLIVAAEDLPLLRRIAERERAPMYVVGEVTGDHRFTVVSEQKAEMPMDLALTDMFGSSPRTIMDDQVLDRRYDEVDYEPAKLQEYLEQVLRLEAVACKDWLTNKVDRCVGGQVAKQQCAGPLQLPLNNCGVMALGFDTNYGVATSIGHAPVKALIDPAAGSRNAVAEALTNLVWAPLEEGLKSVSLSANWMWPCRNEGEDARLYQAVQALSDFCIELGINVPTGKDSLSMKQKYPNDEVIAPGTVIVSSVGVCDNINQIVEPVLQKDGGPIFYLNLSQDTFKLGGSSFAQVRNKVGSSSADIKDAKKLATTFDALQHLIRKGAIVAGHDVASGGLITTLLEMCFADVDLAAEIDLSSLGESDLIKILFAENAAVVIQLKDEAAAKELASFPIPCHRIGTVAKGATLTVRNGEDLQMFNIPALRDAWYETSWLLDKKQTAGDLADQRYANYKHQPLQYDFPATFSGKIPNRELDQSRPKAAILREKGSNSERELAHALYLAGFEVRDVHMTDLMSGRETLEDIQF